MREEPTILGIGFAIIGLLLLILGLFTSNFLLFQINNAHDSSQVLGLYEQLIGILLIIIGVTIAVVGLIIPDKRERQILTPETPALQIQKNTPDNPALQILMTRYAKGEITKDQYEIMRTDLENKGNIIATQQEVIEKTGKPIAGGILLVISASLILIVGLLYMFIFFFSLSVFNQSLPVGTPEIVSFYLLMTLIFDILAFSLGLAGGICSFKRNYFSIAIIGVSLIIVGACLSIFLFFLSIPILVLGILSAVFIGISKKEFS
jgi:uncharacterized membrane protein